MAKCQGQQERKCKNRFAHIFVKSGSIYKKAKFTYGLLHFTTGKNEIFATFACFLNRCFQNISKTDNTPFRLSVSVCPMPKFY